MIVLTALVCVVAAAGDEPIRERPEPYVPSRSELIEIGVITSGYPIPGQLPPEVYPPDAFGLGLPGPPAWLWWLLGAIGAAAVVWVAVRIVRELLRIRWRMPRLGGRRWRWRRRARTAPARVARESSRFGWCTTRLRSLERRSTRRSLRCANRPIPAPP